MQKNYLRRHKKRRKLCWRKPAVKPSRKPGVCWKIREWKKSAPASYLKLRSKLNKRKPWPASISSKQ